jgi:hypothetical protein
MQKKCSRCGETKPATTEYFPQRKTRLDSWCRECYAAKTRNWAATKPEERRSAAQAYYERTKEQRREYERKRGREYNAREAVKESRRKHHMKLKLKTLEAYDGAFCKCCGESILEFLTLDHINADGNEHRKELNGRAGPRFYKWLEANGYPPILQVLCMNCNWARHWSPDKLCPHSSLARNLMGLPIGDAAHQAA